MPIYLDTRGLASVAIAVCDRCKMKRPFVTLGPDFNFPGLRVCDQGCRDNMDPYRLPARQTERINLRFPRPDVSIAVVNTGIATNANENTLLSPEQNTATPSQNGNLDTLSWT
jgi:hypothetical protein